MVSALQAFIAEHGTPDGGLVVGVSGGPDSMALLHALATVCPSLPLFVAHVNHGLNAAEADAAQALVTDYCTRQALPLFVLSANIGALAAQHKRGIEETGRHVRYQHFNALLSQTGACAFATAHTADDNAETVLLHLLRGCGTGGLAGMAAVNGLHWRPLLGATRQQVLAYLAEHNIAYATDSSNDSPVYTRNRVRHELLPLMRTVNPQIDNALLRLAHCASQDDDCLEQLAAQLVYTDGEGHSYGLKGQLLKAHPALRQRALRQLYPLAVGLERKHVLAMDNALRQNSGCELPNSLRFTVRKGKATVHQNTARQAY